MIEQVREGSYELIESKHGTRALTLDSDAFAWINAKDIGELLVGLDKVPKIKTHIARGRYYLYNVKDEPMLHDIEHLELEYGDNNWQGYFLLTGLPAEDKKRTRIIPTSEVITGKDIPVNQKSSSTRKMSDLLFLRDLGFPEKQDE